VVDEKLRQEKRRSAASNGFAAFAMHALEARCLLSEPLLAT